jgi:hypothetical protein
MRSHNKKKKFACRTGRLNPKASNSLVSCSLCFSRPPAALSLAQPFSEALKPRPSSATFDLSLYSANLSHGN